MSNSALLAASSVEEANWNGSNAEKRIEEIAQRLSNVTQVSYTFQECLSRFLSESTDSSNRNFSGDSSLGDLVTLSRSSIRDIGAATRALLSISASARLEIKRLVEEETKIFGKIIRDVEDAIRRFLSPTGAVSAEQEVAMLRDELNALRDQTDRITSLESEIHRLNRESENYQQELHQVRHEKALVENTNRDLEEQLDKLRETGGESVKLSEQNVLLASERNEWKEKATELEETIDKLTEHLEAVVEENAEESRQYDELNERYEAALGRIRELEAKLSSL